MVNHVEVRKKPKIAKISGDRGQDQQGSETIYQLGTEARRDLSGTEARTSRDQRPFIRWEQRPGTAGIRGHLSAGNRGQEQQGSEAIYQLGTEAMQKGSAGNRGQ
jgi:hypothetical protein